MGENTKIEWTQSSWNPWHGCHKVSAGCKNCYMFRDKARYGQDPNVVVRSKTKFYDPLKWKEPRTIFTCSWSDFFIEEADEWRDEAFAIMALTPQHTYQVLTKRPERMLEYLAQPDVAARIAYKMPSLLPTKGMMKEIYREALTAGLKIAYEFVQSDFFLKNVWLGVSVEDKKTADERIPLLLQTPAAVRWLSIEPLLGPMEFSDVSGRADAVEQLGKQALRGIDWVVVGGESGPDARPMHPDWVRSIRDQCKAAGVPFFFKQWGEWLPVLPDAGAGDPTDFQYKRSKQHSWDDFENGQHLGEYSLCVGKKEAGRTLDGRTWDEMPEVSRL